MVENGKNKFRPREFVEFDGRMKMMVIIFSSDTEQAGRREANREKIAREQRLDMVALFGTRESLLKTISNNGIKGGVRKRRSAGGRHIIKGE